MSVPEADNANPADFIFKVVMNKKFRKYSVTPEYQEHIKEAIKMNNEYRKKMIDYPLSKG